MEPMTTPFAPTFRETMRPVVRVAALALSVLAAGCNLPTECDCGPTGATITIPPSRARDVARVGTTGPCVTDCEDRATCESVIHLEAIADGTCRLEILFRSGASPYTAEIEFGFIEGDCCRGYYAKQDRELEVPSGATGVDLERDAAAPVDAGSGCALGCSTTVTAGAAASAALADR
jgi:hypothetical protein